MRFPTLGLHFFRSSFLCLGRKKNWNPTGRKRFRLHYFFFRAWWAARKTQYVIRNDSFSLREISSQVDSMRNLERNTKIVLLLFKYYPYQVNKNRCTMNKIRILQNFLAISAQELFPIQHRKNSSFLAHSF